VLSVRYLPGGGRLVSAAGDGIRMWNVSNGTQTSHCRLGGPHFDRVVVSPRGESVVTGGFEELRVWDVCSESGDEAR
jgi:WD40 repeat protein